MGALFVCVSEKLGKALAAPPSQVMRTRQQEGRGARYTSKRTALPL